MTGREHYREAERLIQEGTAVATGSWTSALSATALYQLAQVHATLAVADAAFDDDDEI